MMTYVIFFYPFVALCLIFKEGTELKQSFLVADYIVLI